jgi:TPR repeat protein
MRLLKLATDQDYTPEQFDLTTFHTGGRAALAKSDEDTVSLYRLAADKGSAVAQYTLGYFYVLGQHGLLRDDCEAARFYKLAADQNYAQALNALASFYTAGRGGLKKNDQEAARLYKLAADQGYVPAQTLLREFEAREKEREAAQRDAGRLPPGKDRETTQKLMRAVKRGDAQAQYNLGVLYETGRGGVLKNIDEAARLYSLAANQGRLDAQAAMLRLVEESQKAASSDNAHCQ